MTFDTLGNKENTAVLLINGMISSAKDCEPFGKVLADKYYVIMPTLDGHGHDGTDLLTVDKEAEKIIQYLNDCRITSLEMIQGSSMGAEIALEVKRQADLNHIKTGVCFFDGGPFFWFTPWFRAIMRARFRKLVKVFDTDNPDKAMEDLRNNQFLQFVAKDKLEQYSGLIRSMASERRHFSDKTVKNLVNICYKCALPDFSNIEQKRFVFFFSKEEPARDSKKRLQKAYPFAEYKDIDGYAHCGFQSVEPVKYAQMLMEQIQKHHQ